MPNSNKIIIIFRGLPGSGKTFICEILADNNPIYSIDDYFTSREGTYHFRFEENHLAYKQCEDNTEAAMIAGAPKIFVHNTFVYDWEMEPYFKMAQRHGYMVHVLTVEKYHDGKNVHDVSEEQIRKMAEKFKVKLM